MPRSTVRLLATTIAALPLLALAGGSVAPAQAEAITAEPLSDRHAFPDDIAIQITLAVDGLDEMVIDLEDVSKMAAVELVVQPGAMLPWHTHPGPAFAKITRGELVYVHAEDCVERPYVAGEGFLDPGFDNVHTAFNPSDDEETVIVATFFGAPDEGELTIPIDADQATALDAACGIER